jgi:DNA-binding IclR family transcriptional regulator
MARAAPATDRTVAVLNFMAVHPDTWFSLSDLARRLDLPKATLHAQVNALSIAGYLLRHPADKTYSLGPALIAVGNAAASRQYEVVEFARDEMRRLADDLDVQVVASAAIADEMVLLARAGETLPVGMSVQIGARIPLVPPLGTVFLAWSTPAEIDAWLRRVGPGTTEAELERYRQAVAAVRSRGYSLGLDPSARTQLARALPDRNAVGEAIEALGHEEYVLLELEHAASYRLSIVGAPVFGADGTVVLALSLFGFPASLTAEEVPRYGNRLLQATDAVSRAIHGRRPAA